MHVQNIVSKPGVGKEFWADDSLYATMWYDTDKGKWWVRTYHYIMSFDSVPEIINRLQQELQQGKLKPIGGKGYKMYGVGPLPRRESGEATGGRKDDQGKPRFDLIPVRPIELLAELYAMGADIYGDRNWEKGMRWGRVFRAMLGHAWAWWRGETYDPKDGQHHLTSVAWCALALLHYELEGIGEDDRVKTACSQKEESRRRETSPPMEGS